MRDLKLSQINKIKQNDTIQMNALKLVRNLIFRLCYSYGSKRQTVAFSTNIVDKALG